MVIFMNLQGSNERSDLEAFNLRVFNFPAFNFQILNFQAFNLKVLSSSLAVALFVCGLLCASGLAQGPIADAPLPSGGVSSFASISPVESPEQHRFWDKENLALFSATAALSVADFSVTRVNLQSGGTELNPIVRVFGRSTAGLAVNFAGETAGVIGMSYFFHKTGHHRLERIASALNIGGSVAAVTYGLTHR